MPKLHKPDADARSTLDDDLLLSFAECPSFQRVLGQLNALENQPSEQSERFTALILQFFKVHPLYRDRFVNIYRWCDLPTEEAANHEANNIIHLVAEDINGNLCAIHCSFYGQHETLSDAAITQFLNVTDKPISSQNWTGKNFASRIFVYTGKAYSNAIATRLNEVKPKCDVILAHDLATGRLKWPDLYHPEDLVKGEPDQLRSYQKEALDAVIDGFRHEDRGCLIMPCGTGKTFTSLRIAEAQVGIGGKVLYLLPSIALFTQTLRIWSEQQELPQKYIGVCSDMRVAAGVTMTDTNLRSSKEGENFACPEIEKDEDFACPEIAKDEDFAWQEIPIPISTDAKQIHDELLRRSPERLNVTFSTYQSLPRIAAAQAMGAPEFDLIICDEAHRTTGVEAPGDSSSPFLLVHDRQKIRAKKRLYMTATARIYSTAASAKAKQKGYGVFSMDNEQDFGREFYRLSFGNAINKGILVDYKVLVCCVSSEEVLPLQKHIKDAESDISMHDISNIIAFWKALRGELFQQGYYGGDTKQVKLKHPLQRAIVFVNTIKHSKALKNEWAALVDHAILSLPSAAHGDALRCEVEHVDGSQNASLRKQKIAWLKTESDNCCRILSNARCLTEGVDVPALDAVMFLQPRRSQGDVVQAVGRVMRKAEGKDYGYILLPLIINKNATIANILEESSFEVIWSVLNALRSHDERFNALLNTIDLNENPTVPQLLIGPKHDFDTDTNKDLYTSSMEQLQFVLNDAFMDAFYTKLVEKCGNRQYWDLWAKDVAGIAQRLNEIIAHLLKQEGSALQHCFNGFLAELHLEINRSITKEQAISLISQHIITGPVFEALFAHYDFANSNPVAKALTEIVHLFSAQGLANEVHELKPFYESVRQRASTLDNTQARQRVLVELYEKFFKHAFPKDTEKLGIVYTPPEVVDFIICSADYIMRKELGRGLTDEGVHILDPFTGTGTFIARLLQSDLIAETDLPRKFAKELHANEIVLLAYYIAAINIEEAYHARQSEAGPYQPFPGTVFCDTFNLTQKTSLDFEVMEDNNNRRRHQQELPITVIIGNPPYSVGQQRVDDLNPNVNYPEIEQRIRQTYVAKSATRNIRSLYDSYKMAIRWASDRIGDEGVIAFVTNASFIEGNADSGLRACLSEEFDTIYCVHLRGNARTRGEQRRKEKDNVFGSGTRAPVAITLMVKKTKGQPQGCSLYFKDIGDYLTREEKLDMLSEAVSVEGIKDWQTIKPDRHHDWLQQRSTAYQRFLPVASKEAKAGKSTDAVFALYSNGLKTGRDNWMYNFSRAGLTKQTTKIVRAYDRVLKRLKTVSTSASLEDQLARILQQEKLKIGWDRELKNQLKRFTSATDLPQSVRVSMYRPFVKQWLCFNPRFLQMTYQMPRIFPQVDSANRVICITGKGGMTDFSALMVDVVPDLGLMSAGQCFPLYRYDKVSPSSSRQRELTGINVNVARQDNIFDEAQQRFCRHYQDDSISKEDIFYYIYGIFHSPVFRFSYGNDLVKDLPRVPFAADFWGFSRAGRQLGDLHTGYERLAPYPLEMQNKPRQAGRRVAEPEAFYGVSKGRMKLEVGENATNYGVLKINEFFKLAGIPQEAHQYKVNGRSPLEWLIARYHLPSAPDESGVIKDPNDWFSAHSTSLRDTIQRLVQMSVETVEIVNNLPPKI